MAKVVFATRRPPWPLDNGARIRAFHLVKGLAERHEVTLLTLQGGPAYDQTGATRGDLERELPGLAGIEIADYGRPLPRGARLGALKPHSDTWGHYATPSVRGALARLSDARTVLHLDDLGMAIAGIDAPAAARVVSTHNVEHRIMREIARHRPRSHRPFMAVEWRKVRREERRVWRAADLCLAVSEVDAATMRAAGARDVELAPNGSAPHDLRPLPPLAPGEPLRLLFVGSLTYWPYTHGVTWFVREVLPKLGDVAVDVVGEHDGGLPQAPQVTYHGRVPAIEPYYEAAHAMVIPVFEGSGTRLKVVESALLGRPMISTALGVEGLPIGDAYLRAETADEFAAAVGQLRGELERGELRRVSEARTALEPLTWPRIADELAARYSTIVR